MQLRDRDGEADAGQHAVHDGGRDGQCRPGHPPYSQEELEQAGGEGDGAGGLPAVLGDEPGRDHGEGGRGAADLQRSAAEQSDHDAADGRGGEARGERGAGGQGDAEGERHGDEEDHQGGREVLRPGGAGTSTRRGVVGGVGGDGCAGDVEGHGSSRLSGGTNAVRSGGESGHGLGGADRLSWVATVWRDGADGPGVRVSPAGPWTIGGPGGHSAGRWEEPGHGEEHRNGCGTSRLGKPRVMRALHSVIRSDRQYPPDSPHWVVVEQTGICW